MKRQTRLMIFFSLDTLEPGENGTVNLTVGLDGESQGNIYQDTLAKLMMNFAVEDNSNPTTPNPPTYNTPPRVKPAMYGLRHRSLHLYWEWYFLFLLFLEKGARKMKKRTSFIVTLVLTFLVSAFRRKQMHTHFRTHIPYHFTVAHRELFPELVRSRSEKVQVILRSRQLILPEIK